MLVRIGIAGAIAINIMLAALALYSGEVNGMDAQFDAFLPLDQLRAGPSRLHLAGSRVLHWCVGVVAHAVAAHGPPDRDRAGRGPRARRHQHRHRYGTGLLRRAGDSDLRAARGTVPAATRTAHGGRRGRVVARAGTGISAHRRCRRCARHTDRRAASGHGAGRAGRRKLRCRRPGAGRTLHRERGAAHRRVASRAGRRR